MAAETKERKKWRNRVTAGLYFADISEFTQAESNMIVEWWDWAMSYFIWYKKTYPHYPEDVLYDAVVEALIYCVKTWDKDKPAKFKTWFHKGCAISVHKYVRRYNIKELPKISENTTAKFRGRDGEDKIKDMYFYGSTQWENEAVDKIDVERILSQLTPRQAEYVKRVYIDGERQADVARSNGVKRQAVEQALKLAKENIRRIVNGDVWREPGKPGRPRKHEKVCS